MKFASSLCALLTAAISIGYISTSSNDANAAYSPDAGVEVAVPVEDSMHEFMEYVFQPTWLRLKVSMATAPTDNKGWKALKSAICCWAENLTNMVTTGSNMRSHQRHMERLYTKLPERKTSKPRPQPTRRCSTTATPVINSLNPESTFCSHSRIF
jgi:hypothetical protein